MRVAVFTDNDFDKVNGVTTALTALLDHAPPDIARAFTPRRRWALTRPTIWPCRHSPSQSRSIQKWRCTSLATVITCGGS